MLAKHIFLILLIKIKSCQEHKKYSIFSLKKIKEREELFLAFESPFWTYQKKKSSFWKQELCQDDKTLRYYAILYPIRNLVFFIKNTYIQGKIVKSEMVLVRWY